MSKNKLTDLNDHLFCQIERLGNEELSPEELQKEVTRAQAIVAVADQIVANAGLQLKAVQIAADHGQFISVPFMTIEFKKP